MRYVLKLLSLLFIIHSTAINAQTKADSISQVFPKIIITNDKNEILLSFDNNRKAYEVPSIGMMEGPDSFNGYLERAAAEIGIRYSSSRMGGLFTYIFPNRYRTFIRPYFVLQFTAYSNGKGLQDSSCKWFPLSLAIKTIPYPASALIVQQVMSKPGSIWAATFQEDGYTNPLDTSKIRFKQLEAFYKLDGTPL